MGRSPHLLMSSHGKAASGSGFGGDPLHRPLAAGLQCSAGGLPGAAVRISPGPRKAAPDFCGCGVFPGSGLGLDLYQLRRLPGGHPDSLSAGDDRRHPALGKYLRSLAPAGVFRILAGFGFAFPLFSDSLEKIFGIYENFVCICEKMGYNRMHENL